MPNRAEIELLLTIARKDLKALSGMTDADVFAEEIFGFHAQQAIEKALKAWLAWLDVEYPRTHDLSLLLSLLQAREADVAPFGELIEYTPYAVQLRYEAFDALAEPLDRLETIRRVCQVVEHVCALCAADWPLGV